MKLRLIIFLLLVGLNGFCDIDHNSDIPLTPFAGIKGSTKGEIGSEETNGYYWSNTPSPYGKTSYVIDQNGAIGFTPRACGASVR